MNDLIILPDWEKLVEVGLNWETGTTKTHEEIAKILTVKTKTTKYYNLVHLALNKLTRLGVRLANVKGEGYKKITADEWLSEAKKKIQKGNNKLKEAQDIINHAPYLEMSEEVRNECIALHDMLIKQKFLLSGGVVKVDITNKKNIMIREGNKI